MRAFVICVIFLVCTPCVEAQFLLWGAEQEPVVPSMQLRPRLVVEPAEVDLGILYDTEKREVDFTIRNEGAGLLRIHDIYTSRMGTPPPPFTAEILPGESLDVRCTFSAANKRGSVKQSYTIRSDDPESPFAQVYLTAQVRKIVEIDPPEAQFFEVERGEGASRVLSVIGRGRGFRVDDVSIRDPGFLSATVIGELEAELDGEPAREYAVRIDVAGDAPPGRFHKVLSIRTNVERRERVNVPITGEVVGELKVLPDRLPMGTLRTEREFRWEIRVTSRKGMQFRVLGVETRWGEGQSPMPMDVTIEPEPDQPLLSYRITITGRTPDEPGFFRGDLVINTDVEGEEERRIPIMVAVRD